MLKTNFKKENGITLIALGVTIVVLSILAGVTIAAITGDNGILKQARNARDTAESAKDEEDSLIDDLIGKLDEEDKSLLPEDLPDIGDAPVLENKDLDEILSLDYIPIYTTEQYQLISTGTTNYEIFDLNNRSVGTYNMLSNAKYALMNDLDFSSCGNVEPIKAFEGEFYGNGYTVKNLTIDKSASTETYPLTSGASGTMDVPAAMFDVVHGANIHDIYIDNINVKGKRTVAALVGEGTGNLIIDNCYLSNSTINSLNYFATAGIIGYIYNSSTSYTAKITNCRVSEVEISSNSDNYTAGIISTCFSNLKIDNCNVLNIESEISAGILHYLASNYSLTLSNSNVQNLIILQGSLVSVAEGSSVTIDNCNAKQILTNWYQSAGIIGFCKGALNITNCNVQDFNTNAPYVAGIVNISFGISTIDGCSVKNITCNSSNLTFSGIINFCYKPASITNCNVIDISLMLPASSSGNYIAGIAGFMYATSDQEILVDSCFVDNMVISENTSSNVGGIVGFISTNSSSPKSILINKCYVTNSKISGNYNVGGIVSCVLNNDFTIQDCFIKDSTISGHTNIGGILGLSSPYTKFENNIFDCIVENCEIYGIAQAGGISGFTCDTLIQNCNINKTKISGGSRIGGVVGFLGSLSTLKNCDVSNCEIESTIIACGGIAGHGQNSGSSVTHEINNCDVSSTNIKGLDEVGGICGASTINITDCNVTNSSIVATGQYVGGIQGTAGSDSYAEITNCHVKSTDISGAEDVGDIQGKGGYDASTGALLGNDVITNCTRE